MVIRELLVHFQYNRYILIMIKLKWALRFSTLRFSEQYLRTFQLNRQLRACTSLKDLQNCIERNDAVIQNYGKTIVLQCFNEFPLGYIYGSMDSELRVFNYMHKLQGLTLYEEQLKYANICKLMDYAAYDASWLKEMAHDQERNIIQLCNKYPFDLVDAFNWILFQRAYINSKITDYALGIISNSPLDRSESLMIKLLNSFLKKFQDMQWSNLRKHRHIFQFLCFKYQPTIQSPKMMVSNFEKITELKLHQLGYDRVPLAIDRIIIWLQGELQSLETHYLMAIFKCFENLPTTYNRQFFNKIYRQVLKRIQNEVIHLTTFPISRLTPNQLQTIMEAFVRNGFFIRSCVYFINEEDSKNYLSSQALLKAFTEEFLRPIMANESVLINYTGYMSLARALLDHYGQENPIYHRIQMQTRNIQRLVEKKGFNLQLLVNDCSLCGWFNIYSLQLELGLFKKKRQFEEIIDEKVNIFNRRQYSSTWKVRKHHKQIREVLIKHADSPFPQIRQLQATILESIIEEAKSFDSIYFPPYIFILEDCQKTSEYQTILASFYQFLHGENLFAFIEAYICSSYKSTKLTLKIIQKLWALSHSSVMVLKLTAGVPVMYFENGEGRLMKEVATLLQEVAILMKGDLEPFSLGQMVSIVRFCRKFIKLTRIFSHKILILFIANISQRLQMIQKVKNPEIFVNLLMELLYLTFELAYSDMELIIARITQLFSKFQQLNVAQPPLIMLRLIEVKLILKASAPINSVETLAFLKRLVERALGEDELEERAKIVIILLKMHALKEVQLKPQQLQQFSLLAKKGLQDEAFFPSDIPTLLGVNFIDQCDLIEFKRLKQLKEIILFSLKEIGIQETSEHYIYLLQLAHKLRNEEIVECCVDHLIMVPLEPSYTIALVNILKYYTSIYRVELIQRLLKDTATHITTLHHLDVLYYLNVVCYDLPPEHSSTYSKLLKEVEKELTQKAVKLLGEGCPEGEELIQVLTMTYKYYWVVLKNNQITETTTNIFKLNIRSIKTIFVTLNSRFFDGISLDIIYMMHLVLFSKFQQAYPSSPPKQKGKLFSKKASVQYQEYRQYIEKIKDMAKLKPFQSFELEEQLAKLKIYYKERAPKETYFTTGEWKNGIVVHYCIYNREKVHYVFVRTSTMRNHAGLLKGRVKLYQQLYNLIIGSDTIQFDQSDPFTIKLE